METKLTLHPLLLGQTECIALLFAPDKDTEALVRRIPRIKWSQPHRCWCLPMTPEAYRAARELLAGKVAWDESGLRAYGDKRKQVAATVCPQGNKRHRKPGAATVAWQLDAANLTEMERFIQQLQLQAYSESTIHTYRSEFLQLLKLLGNRLVSTLTPDDLRRYMVHAMEQEGISENTAHSRLNALKFYFEKVLGRERFFWEIPRPKKRLILPKVLNERELERMFGAVGNLKHKALLFTAYSAGLRVSEVVHLKIADIDSGRMQILVEQSKGKKDRYLPLSVLLLDVLRAYLIQAYPRPVKYLFEGDTPGEPYATRTAQQIFNKAKQEAGILKKVSFHVLRHSFATHLLEKGIDTRYIKDLLGHFNIKTTERYLHVRREDLIRITNPLDELFKGKSWQ